MEMHNLGPAVKGKNRNRVGRGIGSGNGKRFVSSNFISIKERK